VPAPGLDDRDGGGSVDGDELGLEPPTVETSEAFGGAKETVNVGACPPVAEPPGSSTKPLAAAAAGKVMVIVVTDPPTT
jgi:hypothetical protein